MLNQNNNKYTLNFDKRYVRAVHFTPNLAKALGFFTINTLPTEANKMPTIYSLHSQICIFTNDMVSPINYSGTRDTFLGFADVRNGRISLSNPCPRLKMNTNSIDTITLEFRDLQNNPLYCEPNTEGRAYLEFIKK